MKEPFGHTARVEAWSPLPYVTVSLIVSLIGGSTETHSVGERGKMKDERRRGLLM